MNEKKVIVFFIDGRIKTTKWNIIANDNDIIRWTVEDLENDEVIEKILIKRGEE